MTGSDLQRRALALIGRGGDGVSTDQEFDDLARSLFAFQFQQCAPYRAHCVQQQRTPETVRHWQQIPAVPTSAFKDFALASFPVAEAVAEFHTSGTTGARTGRHYFPTLALYQAALRPQFVDGLLPEPGRLRMLALVAAPAEAPHSSLSYMIGQVLDEFGAPTSAFYVHHDRLETDRLAQDLGKAQRAGQPVCLLGTALGFVHLFDGCARESWQFELPEGSRAMETGGFKARAQELSKPELYRLFERYLGIPAARVVNEYGMTELSSQFYDETLRIGRPTDCKRIPPWVRVLIVDPHTGQPAPPNERGLIRIFDLANVWSLACVQTEDLGVVDAAGRLIVHGRAAGAEARGCSLTAEAFVTS